MSDRSSTNLARSERTRPAHARVPGGDVASFMGLELLVGGGAPAPSADTELLGLAARDILSRRVGSQIVVDMCCGCGALAIALATHCPSAFVYACDVTRSATATAAENARRAGLSDRVIVRRGEFFGALAGERLAHRVDLVVCAPARLDDAAREGDRDEMSRLERVVREAADHLRPGGWLAVEFGDGRDRVARLALEGSRRFDAAVLLPEGGRRPCVALARRRTDS
ncbi:MAG: class I SAM-dependent methyltransferase [Microvirga sp.]|nr:class I SAM-dependent methyltransferase [Microvirga sp.]